MSFNLVEGDVTLYDKDGNPVKVTQDGSDYKLDVLAKLLAGSNEIGKVRITDGTHEWQIEANGEGRVMLYDGANKIGSVDVSALRRLLVDATLTDAGGDRAEIDPDGAVRVRGDFAQNAADIFAADFYRNVTVAGPSYYIYLDLDNNGGAGSYGHPATAARIIFGAFYGTVLKSSTSSQWDVLLGVVSEIDGTQAKIRYISALTAHARDTSRAIQQFSAEPFPAEINLGVVGSALDKAVGGRVEITTDVNTAGTLQDILGGLRTPAVGDIILKAERLTGAGSAEVHVTGLYRTEDT